MFGQHIILNFGGGVCHFLVVEVAVLTSDNILASPEQHSSIPGHPLGVAVEPFLHRHSTKFWRGSNSTATFGGGVGGGIV